MGDLLTLNLNNRNGNGDIWHNGEIIPVIKYKHMPRTITAPFERGEYGEDKIFSFYKGVIVEWDEDMDTRILNFIDGMEFQDTLELLLVAECEGCISLLWRAYIPSIYMEGSDQIEVRDDGWGCDWWTIQESCKISDR